jgi:hypothetical protein
MGGGVARLAERSIDNMYPAAGGCQLLSACHGSHGFTTDTCVVVKSPRFREQMVRLWWIAVAASKPSMADKACP